MGGITEAMLKRRAEHNDGVLYTLEELVLQEEGLEKIDRILGTLCPHLKFLYMPNNLIPRIENLHRLKELQYLNLALNNITKIEGLEQCECLEKLDLTLNFLDLKELPSISKLSCNVRLRELYLTGNPCQDLNDYRFFVIATLPFLKRLDGVEVKPSEKIRAKQIIGPVMQQLKCVNMNGGDNDTISKTETVSEINEKGQIVRDYTPATRLAEHAELEEMRGQNKPQKEISKENLKNSRRRHGFDPLPAEGRLYQKNEGGWNFRLSESDCKSKVLLDVPVGRYMDISLIDIDIQPAWVRVLVKGKLLQLLLPEEVNPDASVAQRSMTTGNLMISMPKASCNARVNVKTCNSSPVFYSSHVEKRNREIFQARSKLDAANNRVNDFTEQPLKKELVVSKTPQEGSHIKQEQYMDEHAFDELPALE